MTTRNLDALFAPRSIALIGASNRPQSVGAVVARNLQESGFAGPVFPVNPHQAAIRSTACYADIDHLPAVPDLAVIASPAATIAGDIAKLGAKGCRAAVIISAGFEADANLKRGLLEAARPTLLRIMGPNCLGFLSPKIGLNASFAHISPLAGHIALVAQSGAIAAAALDWATSRGIGFSHIVTLGDEIDVDFGDLLDYLALDPETHAILLYVESVADARKFMTAGRIAARNKPVIVIKTGRSQGGARAAFSHTGSLAGSDAVYDAAFRRAGMLRVSELRELFDAVTTLQAGQRYRGDRLAILTNGGGAGVMATDALEEAGGRLAVLSVEGTAKLRTELPAAASVANPVDILGDAQAERYEATLKVLLAEPEVDAVLVMNCPTAVADSALAAKAVADVRQAISQTAPIFTVWLGDRAAAPGRSLLTAAGLPSHETPDEGVRAFMHMVRHDRSQKALLQAPGTLRADYDRASARRVIDACVMAGRSILDPIEVHGILTAYGIPVVEPYLALDAKSAGDIAARLGGSVALKIRSPDISHKSDAGGVVLNLVGAAAVEAAADAMARSIQQKLPQARLEGFLVEPIVSKPKGEETIAGIMRDPVFGPVVLFGQGGVAVEVDHDRTLGLAPLNEVLAHDMIARTRLATRLAGYRDHPAANTDAVAQVLTRLSQLALDCPEVAELDINPLLVDADGVIGVDARIRLAPDAVKVRPAILPYPDGLESVAVVDGQELRIRPIRPQDAAALQTMVKACSPLDLELRFRGSLRELPQAWLTRLTQIDYDREMALVAEYGTGKLLGVARLAADPEGLTAEFALIVRTDWHGRGLGHLLMERLMAYAVGKGLQNVWGNVGRDNAIMLDLANRLGFVRGAADEADRVLVIKDMSPVVVDAALPSDKNLQSV